MRREEMLLQLEQTTQWDLVIIGGGATGLGAAVDAASRGLKTLLIERSDFAKGTSSRSTKLVHGGVRYLAQGNIKLVKEALRERGYLLKNAAHLCTRQGFVIPVYSWFDKMFYAVGLKIYDLLSGKLSLGKTALLSAKATSQLLPSIHPKKLAGGILYYDGQFDDSRLAIDLAVTAAEHGACMLNYMELQGFEKKEKKIQAIQAMDKISGKTFKIRSQSFINATGVFTDAVMQMDEVSKASLVSPSQGIHLVVSKHFFQGSHAMMIPKTADGRVLFAVPWHEVMVLGTTDTPIDEIKEEPRAMDAEIDFIMDHFNHYCHQPIQRKDVQSVFVGLRPLVKAGSGTATSVLSRDHTILVSSGGLVTITGGKWTTYRKMAEDAVNNAVFVSKLQAGKCNTENLSIGQPEQRRARISAMMEVDPSLSRRIHPDYSYTYAEISYAIRYELAETIEDLLARRTRLLFMDARIAMAAAPEVAALLAREKGLSQAEIGLQLDHFQSLAAAYLAT